MASSAASAATQTPVPSETQERAPVARTAAPITARREVPAPVTPVDVGGKTARRAGRRRRLRAILMLGGIAAVVIGAGVVWMRGGRYVSADDAYVRASKLMVSTDVSGLVSEIDVHEGQKVAADQVLFKIDPRQYEIALQQAKAQLGQAELSIHATKEDYRRILSDIESQSAQVDLAQTNFDRAASLLKTDFGTRATYDQTHFTLLAAQKTLQSLKQQAQVTLARLNGNADAPVETMPQWQQAKAQVDEAQRQLDHTVVRAPFAGVATQVDALQLGTYLVSQTAALTNTGAVGLVSASHVWVDANLKETDLTYVKPGDPVDISVDSYPGRVWTGKVDSISPASGAEFSILPPQNASGNWVKVVQRIPVRIAVEQKEGYPVLRSGMSVIVDIDTGHKRSLSELWGGAPAERSDVPAKP
ncbi:MAG: HlyD family secretion protein [Hyphomicrobiales bacterium]|nr:HlyD family secretion protein [Hyphomicrobiales bacterium]